MDFSRLWFKIGVWFQGSISLVSSSACQWMLEKGRPLLSGMLLGYALFTGGIDLPNANDAARMWERRYDSSQQIGAPWRCWREPNQFSEEHFGAPGMFWVARW